jgi:DNA mismatch repair protein MSH5
MKQHGLFDSNSDNASFISSDVETAPMDATEWLNNNETTNPTRDSAKMILVYELDESLGDLRSEITDRQHSILIHLEDQLLDFENDLLQVSIAVGTLDAFISLGEISLQFKLTCPSISDDDVLVIKNGRHILQEQTVDCFIPNDTYIANDKNIAVITGPNGSGKSIYLKQVGLIVYLAHIGCFVPAEKAIIGLTDKIFTRISSEESITDYHSSFSLDVNQVSKMLNHYSSKSLCLLDEFGKGTNPVDGMSLLAAVIKFFSCHHIKAIFALHFMEILNEQILSFRVFSSINCFRMETITESDENEGIDDGLFLYEDLKLIPMFKLKYGIEKSSHGIACAKSIGLPESVLQRAQEIKYSLHTKTVLSPLPVASLLDVQNVRTKSRKDLSSSADMLSDVYSDLNKESSEIS